MLHGLSEKHVSSVLRVETEALKFLVVGFSKHWRYDQEYQHQHLQPRYNIKSQMRKGHVVTCEGVRKSRRLEGTQELSEPTLSVRPECLDDVADWKWEHDSVHSMCDALGDRDVVFVPRDAGSVDRHHLEHKKLSTDISSWHSCWFLMLQDECILSFKFRQFSNIWESDLCSYGICDSKFPQEYNR